MLQEQEPILYSDEKKSTAFWQQTLKMDLVYEEGLVIWKRT